MQSVVDQQHSIRSCPIAAIAAEFIPLAQVRAGTILQHSGQLPVCNGIGGDRAMLASGKRCRFVEKPLSARNDGGAARRVVRSPAGKLAFVRDGVGAVERVVEAAPARVGSVERIARISERGLPAAGRPYGRFPHRPRSFPPARDQVPVADTQSLGETPGKRQRRAADRAARRAICRWPRLQPVSLAEQRAIARAELPHDVPQARPEGLREPAAR
jgi:hypothetical protein